MAEQTKRPKEILYLSPKGVAKWAKLDKPDTKYKAEGAYSVELILDPKDPKAQPFIESLEFAHKKGFAEAQKAHTNKKIELVCQKLKAGPETDKDGAPTGKLIVSFSCKASGKRADGTVWTFKPHVFDAGTRPLPDGVIVYGGSVIQVSYSIRHTPMPTGLFYTSFNLKAVQVLDLKSAGVRSASDFGFKAEEGYESDEDAAAGEPDTDSSGVGDGSSDF